MAKLDDFLTDWNGLLTFDLEKMKNLSAKEFTKRRAEEMESFMQNHLFLKDAVPNCLDCSEPVRKAKDLVRYFGGNYHNGCFLETYGKERKDLGRRERNYFDLVQSSIMSNASI